MKKAGFLFIASANIVLAGMLLLGLVTRGSVDTKANAEEAAVSGTPPATAPPPVAKMEPPASKEPGDGKEVLAGDGKETLDPKELLGAGKEGKEPIGELLETNGLTANHWPVDPSTEFFGSPATTKESEKKETSNKAAALLSPARPMNVLAPIVSDETPPTF